MAKPTKVQYGQGFIDAQDLDVRRKDEQNSIYELEDGTTIEARLIIKRISRVDGKLMGKKGPSYRMDYDVSVTAKNIPPELFEPEGGA